MQFFKKKKKYLATVIMAVYNAEDYLAEAIESVIGQTVGIDTIQLILVDDGSSDSSSSICDNYHDLYPNNIIVVHKENGGVSSARNIGLDLAEGRYTGFLDSDDRLESDAIEKMTGFLKKHEREINCVSIPVRIFGYREYEHPMNSKYVEDGLIDIRNKPDALVTLVCNVMFRTSAIGDMRFQEGVTLGEDTLFATEFLMKHSLVYGIVTDTCWWYRKHEPGISLSGDNYHNRIWYLDYPRNVLMAVVELSRQINGEVTPYVQHLIFYWLKYAILDKGIHDTLSPDEEKEFDGIYKQLLQMIDDSIISKGDGLPMFCRNHMLRLKYDEDVFAEAEINETGQLIYRKQVIFSPRGGGLVRITDISMENDCVILSGITRISRAEGKCELYVDPGDEGNTLIPIQMTEMIMHRLTYDGATANREDMFTVTVPRQEGKKCRFVTRYIDDKRLYEPKVDCEAECKELCLQIVQM